MNFLSDRSLSIEPSATVAISTKAMQLKKQGLDIISLSAGEPDFPVAEHIAQAMIQAIKNKQTKYTELDGTPELRAAISQKLLQDNGLEYKTDQILVSVGAKHSFYNLFAAVLNPGDEVIILAPYWVSYPAMAKLMGAIPVILSPEENSQNLKVQAEQIQKAITPKTKLLVLNSPSNPTGEIYSKEELEKIGNLLKNNKNILIASDDIYEKIIWSNQESNQESNQKFHNILNTNPELYEQTIVINGLSKSHAMTGLRIGYAAGPKEIIKAMSKIQGQSTSNPCSIAQAGATAALLGNQDHIPVMVQAYKTRQDFLFKKLNQIPGFIFHGAEGAFYAFVNIKQAILNLSSNLKINIQANDDVKFCEFLLEKALVAAVPGSAFGMPGYIRLSYATDLKTLETVCERIRQALS